MRWGLWRGTSGRPRSANGASSFHLTWDAPSGRGVRAGRWVRAEAELEVQVEPTVDALYFWALQVSFTDAGRHGGAAHLGLQWHPSHPGSRAVNWGGYAPGGGELSGSDSALPSATANPNTRDLHWSAGRRYRLRSERDDAVAAPSGTAAWRGSVHDGDEVVVRHLWAPGRHLAHPVVWSEVFADCAAPSTRVRWSGLRLTDESGTDVAVTHVRVNYQALSDGGCTNTDSRIDGDGFVQVTSVERRTRQGAELSRS